MNDELTLLLERLSELEKGVLESPAPDYASYREMVGRYNGMKEAIQILVSYRKEDTDDF